MTYPQDFHITYFQWKQGQNSIDSYELLKNIIDETDVADIQFKLDNSLPLIKGNLKSIKAILKEFIENSLSAFNGNKGTLHIRYREDLDSSILAYFTNNLSSGIDENSSLVDSISNFNLAICKKTVSEVDQIENTHFRITHNILKEKLI